MNKKGVADCRKEMGHLPHKIRSIIHCNNEQEVGHPTRTKICYSRARVFIDKKNQINLSGVFWNSSPMHFEFTLSRVHND